MCGSKLVPTLRNFKTVSGSSLFFTSSESRQPSPKWHCYCVETCCNRAVVGCKCQLYMNVADLLSRTLPMHRVLPTGFILGADLFDYKHCHCFWCQKWLLAGAEKVALEHLNISLYLLILYTLLTDMAPVQGFAGSVILSDVSCIDGRVCCLLGVSKHSLYVISCIISYVIS